MSLDFGDVGYNDISDCGIWSEVSWSSSMSQNLEQGQVERKKTSLMNKTGQIEWPIFFAFFDFENDNFLSRQSELKTVTLKLYLA